MIEFALHAYLTANAAIAARVGTQIYPLRIPQSVDGDKITYRRKSGVRPLNLQGGIDLVDAVFEIACYSQSYDRAKLLSKDLRLALSGFINGPFGSGAGEVQVKVVRHLDEEDGYYAPEEGSDEGWFVVVNEYAVKYHETAPTF